MQLSELKLERKQALDAADKILSSVESTKRNLTDQESKDIDNHVARANTLSKQIEVIESKNTILSFTQKNGFVSLMGHGDGSRIEGQPFSKPQPKHFSEDYAVQFFEYLGSNGQKIGATLNEGASPAGGYAVPIVVDDQIVPLAPQEMAIRQLATVVPTKSDVKIPVKASFGTTSAKAETASFGNSEFTLSQTTLSAFMAGNVEEISWELAQDVPVFQATAMDDLILAQQQYEENLYINGTGMGQAQGLIGNVGAGVMEEPDTNGNMVSITGTLDLIGTLNEVYHANANWLMRRSTSIGIRKAQVQTNLFNPVWTRTGSQDYLHGYPVKFASVMPAATRGLTPVLFGDFKRGYIIGDRGGSGINIKILDQPKATQGILQLLAYRRTDGRVRRSEAIQGYTIALS